VNFEANGLNLLLRQSIVDKAGEDVAADEDTVIGNAIRVLQGADDLRPLAIVCSPGYVRFES
jgi:hypothetical protein